MIREARFQEGAVNNSTLRQDCSWEMGWQKQPGLSGDSSRVATWNPSSRLDWAVSAVALGMTRPQFAAVGIDFRIFSVSLKTLRWRTGNYPVWKSLFPSALSTLYEHSLQQGLLSPPWNQSPAAVYDATFLYKEYLLCLLVVTFTTHAPCLVEHFTLFLQSQHLWSYCLHDS